jgi:hypothetical protein
MLRPVWQQLLQKSLDVPLTRPALRLDKVMLDRVHFLFASRLGSDTFGKGPMIAAETRDVGSGKAEQANLHHPIADYNSRRV